MNCRVDGCGREAAYKKARLCQKHYFRVRRTGTTQKAEPEYLERFARVFNKRARHLEKLRNAKT